MSWENLVKDQGIFTGVIILLILRPYLLTVYEHIGMQKGANFTIVSSTACTCMITSNEPWNTQNESKSTNHKS